MPKPNIIIFLTDDQGYGDLSCMGATDFATPNLDQLAADGARFTDWYSNSPVCSPSRASLLTGRYPGNAGVRSILAGHRRATGLPRDVPTIATALSKLGYSTAMFGKWHLGLAEGSRPWEHGFEQSFTFLAGCIDYFSHIFYWGMGGKGEGSNPTHDLWENGKEVWNNGEYFTEMVTKRAVDFVHRSAQSGKPFFMYVPYNAPHYPMHAPQKYLDRFKDLPPDRRIMAAMIAAVDDGVGAIMAELKRCGIDRETIIFFTSDNGPSRETRNWLDGREDPYYGGSSGKLKGHKFSLFEGGVRVPAILKWPEKMRAGQVIGEPCATMDIFPTLLAAAGGNARDYEIDGRDISPLACDGKSLGEREIFWEMQKQTAVRRGKWKLVLNGQLVESEKPEDLVHLADLENDAGEKTNLEDQHPQITNELKAACEKWREKIETRWNEQFKSRASVS